MCPPAVDANSKATYCLREVRLFRSDFGGEFTRFFILPRNQLLAPVLAFVSCTFIMPLGISYRQEITMKTTRKTNSERIRLYVVLQVRATLSPFPTNVCQGQINKLYFEGLFMHGVLCPRVTKGILQVQNFRAVLGPVSSTTHTCIRSITRLFFSTPEIHLRRRAPLYTKPQYSSHQSTRLKIFRRLWEGISDASAVVVNL